MTRYVGAFLILSALVVGIHTVIEPLYFSTTVAQPASPVWVYLDYLMAVAVVLGLVFSYTRKMGQGGSGDLPLTRDFLEANFQFYGLAFIGILFFWNWFSLLSPEFTNVSGDGTMLVWIVVDAGFAVLCWSLGMHLWGSGNTGD